MHAYAHIYTQSETNEERQQIKLTQWNCAYKTGHVEKLHWTEFDNVWKSVSSGLVLYYIETSQ